MDDAPTSESTSTRNRQLLATGTVVVLATVAVKMFEVAKNIISVSKFGISAEADIYNVVLGIPEMIVVVLGLDTIRGATTTFFTEHVTKDDITTLRDLVSSFVSWGSLVSLLLVLLTVIFMRDIIALVASGFAGDKFELSVRLGYIVLPVLLLRIFLGLFIGVFNAHNVFAKVTLFPLISSIPGIIVLLVSERAQLLFNMSIAYTASYVVYILALGAYSRKYVKWRFSFNHVPPQFWDILRFAGSLFLATTMSQVASIVERRTASYFPDGTIASLNSAYLLAGQFLLIVVVSLFGVFQREITATVSRDDDMGAVRQTWRIFANLFFVVVVGAVSIAILRYPILQFLYRRQAFDEIAVARTAKPLFVYSFWILGQTLSLTVTALLLAMKKSRIFVISSFIGYGLNALVVGVCASLWGYVGVAYAAVVGSVAYAIALLVGMRWIFGREALSGLSAAARILVAGIAFGLAMQAALVVLPMWVPWITGYPLGQIILALLCGLPVYLGVAQILKVNFAWFMLRQLRQSIPNLR